MKSALLLALVVVTHYGYPFFASGPAEASWAFYVLRGIEGAALFFLVSRTVNTPVALIACWLGVFEESQTAVCGVTASGESLVPLWSGLCLQQFGIAPYFAMAVIATGYLWVKTPKRPPSPPAS